MLETYYDRQTAQLRKFMEWVKKEGGVEGPTQLSTMAQTNQQARVAWLKQHVVGDTVLEVGTNMGYVLAHVSPGLLSGKATGVDINPANIELAKLLVHTAVFQVADAVTLPFPDVSFDTVMLPEVLEHLDWPDGVHRAIDEAKRVSAQRVLVTMPDGDKDTEEATNFKHLWLCTNDRARQIAEWLRPGHVTLEYQAGFVLIRGDHGV